MEASTPDVEMLDSTALEASSDFPLPADVELPDIEMSHYDLYDSGPTGLEESSHADNDFTQLPELTEDVLGDATPRTNGSDSNAPAAQVPHFDPRALLNPKSSAIKRPASSGGEADRGRADPTIAGQISLVERLHNVQERTASPAKRIKTEDEQKKASTNRAKFGSGSALELQKSQGQAPVQTGPAIDLTMSDDEEELQVMEDNTNQVICIGKLKNAYIQSHCVPFPDPKKGRNGQYGRIKVSFRRSGSSKADYIIIAVDPTNKEFGKVDAKTARGLCPVMDASKANGLRWMVWTDPRRKQAHEGPPGALFSGLISVTLQLYCPRRYSDAVGRALAHRQVHLTRPQFELAQYDYYNPQDGDSLARQQALRSDFRPEVFAQSGSGATAPSNYVLRSVDEIRADVSDVFDTVVNKSNQVPTREPSSHIKTELYPHQKQALYFMWDKEQDHTAEEFDERSDSLWKPKYRDNGRKYYVHIVTGEEQDIKPKQCRGGILADEMGLGKTLSVLSLVSDDDSIKASQEFARKKPPPIAAELRKLMLQPVINSRATLLICPLSTMTNWKEQLNDHFPAGSGLKWARYHGSERFTMKADELADHDIIITTYHIIAKDFRERTRPLPWINWFRIVLDEAHTIRNPTNQSRAACALFGQRRWAVTGTPVQNRLEDLGALFNFIRLAPFNTNSGFNQWISAPFKNVDPDVVQKLQLIVSTVTMRRTKEIIKDEIPQRNDFIVKLDFSQEEQKLHDWFEQDTKRKVTAVTSGDKMGGKSYARILTAILNMRLICAHGRDLLSEEALKTTDGMTYDNPMEIGEEETEMAVLSRQQAYEMLDLLDQTNNAECVFCSETTGKKRSILELDSDDDEDDDGDTNDIVGHMTPCYHLVCPKHLKKLREQWNANMRTDGKTTCQICEDAIRPVAFELPRSDFHNFLEERDRLRHDPKLSKKVGSYTGASTKTKALLNDLEEHRQWSDEHQDERPIKSVVFSCWTTHLDLIEIALRHHQHVSCRLDGRMSRDARDKSMRVFREDPNVRVMLVSIGAGGLGLNLTTANKVFMMEPQFNPAAEAQAVDRVHRLGQDREVVIKRFIMERSFEIKMVELQQKKKMLADLTMARERKTKDQQTKQRLEEIRSLFR